jgi:zinc transporter, ZIP family
LLLGGVAQVSLLLSGLLASWVTVPRRIIGWLAGFGAGALVSAIPFDLTKQAEALGGVGLSVWLLIGAAVFIVGDYVVERRFGAGGGSGRWGSW